MWTSLNSEITSHKFESRVVVVESLSHVWLFVTPWTAAARLLCSPLSLEVCSNSSKSVVQSNHLLLCHHLLLLLSIFPSTRVFSNESALWVRWPNIGTSASVLPMNIQGWFPLGLTDLISLQSKGLSRVSSSTTIQKHQFFGAQPSLWTNYHIHTWLLEKT